MVIRCLTYESSLTADCNLFTLIANLGCLSILLLMTLSTTILQCGKGVKKEQKDAKLTPGTPTGESAPPKQPQKASMRETQPPPPPPAPVNDPATSLNQVPSISADNNNVTEKTAKQLLLKDDSFEQHKPVTREAKRGQEIRDKGPVSKHRNDYKTLQQMATSDFDQSLGV